MSLLSEMLFGSGISSESRKIVSLKNVREHSKKLSKVFLVNVSRPNATMQYLKRIISDIAKEFNKGSQKLSNEKAEEIIKFLDEVEETDKKLKNNENASVMKLLREGKKILAYLSGTKKKVQVVKVERLIEKNPFEDDEKNPFEDDTSSSNKLVKQKVLMKPNSLNWDEFASKGSSSGRPKNAKSRNWNSKLKKNK